MAKKGPSTIQDRLHRVGGQIRGVERLVNEGESVEKVMTQLQAAISSLESVKVAMIKSQIREKLMSELDNVVDLIK